MRTKDVGIYSILSMVAGIGQIVGQIFYIYVEPKILKLHSENNMLAHKILNRYILILSIIFFIMMIIVILLPKKIYTLLISPNIIYNNYYFVTMIILLISVFVTIIHTAHHIHLKLLKKLNILAIIFFIGFIVNLIGNLFIKEYGIIMAAFSTLVAYIIILILQILYVNYFYKGREIDKI